MLNVSEVLTILEKEGLTSSRQVVLRWIRQGDLPAVQESRKTGYQVNQTDNRRLSSSLPGSHKKSVGECCGEWVRRPFSFQEKCQYSNPFSGFQGNGGKKFQHREEQSLLPNRDQESLSPLRTEDTGEHHLCLSFGGLL